MRIMTVPNQVPGLDYNATPAAQLADVPDCKPCPAYFTAAGAFANCQCNSLKWTRPTEWPIAGGFSATAWYQLRNFDIISGRFSRISQP